MNLLKQLALGAALAGALAMTGFSATAEKAVGSTVESRVLLGFKVSDAAVKDFLPEGWTSFTIPKGPVGGANLIFALIDRHVILDAEGKPENPSSGPTAAMLAYARMDGIEGIRAFVVRVYEETPIVDPYANSVPADIERIAGFTDSGQGERVQSERWTIQTEAGGEIRFELEHNVGGFMWSMGGESRPYSSVNPYFHRIYRYDQLVSLAMNTAMGRELNGTVSFTSSDPAIDALFDGTQELVSIVSIPTYIRVIALP